MSRLQSAASGERSYKQWVTTSFTTVAEDPSIFAFIHITDQLLTVLGLEEISKNWIIGPLLILTIQGVPTNAVRFSKIFDNHYE